MHVRGDRRVLLRKVELLSQDATSGEIIPPDRARGEDKGLKMIICCNDLRNKGDISNSELVAYEPLLLRQDGLKHTQYTLDLVLVTIYRARDLLGVEDAEPDSLAEIGTLA